MNFKPQYQLVTLLLFVIAIVTALTTTACGNSKSLTKEQRLAGFEKSVAIIEAKSGERHRFTVYLAITPTQRKQGLSFITGLAREEGMLFVFPQPQPIRMWMKNTPTSLDMLFVDQSGTILKIVRNTTPNSTDSIRSGTHAAAVLELDAGTASRLNIDVGDRLLHERLN
jgi:uncharacterized membrane protein (UPF0127 family)